MKYGHILRDDMAAKVHYSDKSKNDLEEIGDYIAEELKNPSAAFRTVSRIQDTIDKLTDFPLMGMLLSAIVEADTGDYRFLVCGKYIAFYRPQEENILIDRILYGKRDYIAVLLHGLELDEMK